MLIVTIQNDGSGDIDTGNYDCKVYVNKCLIASGRVEDHKRADGWRDLLIDVANRAESELEKKIVGLYEEK